MEDMKMKQDESLTKTKQEIYDRDYVPFMLRWGRLATLIAMLGTLVPVAVLHIFFGARIDWSTFPVLAITLVGMMIDGLVNHVFTYPILGISGTFMAYVTGDLNNMKIPCSIAAQSAAGVEIGTEESGLISAIGIATATFVKLIVIFLAVVVLGAFLANLPPDTLAKLKMMIPAMMGGIIAKYCLMKPKAAPMILVVGVGVQILVHLGIIPVILEIIVTVASCILIAYILFRKNILE